MITALITGIGGTNSLAILKALQASGIKHTSIGTDVKALNAGSYLVDESYLIPPVSSQKEYLASIEKIIHQKKVNIIFATTETEIAYLSTLKNDLEEKYNVSVIVADSEVLKISQDKYTTQQFLKEYGFVDIPTITTEDKQDVGKFAEEQGYPLICKPRQGYGSRGISVIRNNQELKKITINGEFVLQKYIESEVGAEFDEYTAEIFINKDGSVAGGIIIARTLLRGESNNGKVVKDDNTLTYLMEVARKLGVRGPCNFQYRKNNGVAYIFEINARYSGTSAVRAHYGFNNVAMAIESFVYDRPQQVSGEDMQEGYFIRYWEEVYIPETSLDKLETDRHIENYDKYN